MNYRKGRHGGWMNGWTTIGETETEKRREGEGLWLLAVHSTAFKQSSI